MSRRNERINPWTKPVREHAAATQKFLRETHERRARQAAADADERDAFVQGVADRVAYMLDDAEQARLAAFDAAQASRVDTLDRIASEVDALFANTQNWLTDFANRFDEEQLDALDQRIRYCNSIFDWYDEFANARQDFMDAQAKAYADQADADDRARREDADARFEAVMDTIDRLREDRFNWWGMMDGQGPVPPLPGRGSTGGKKKAAPAKKSTRSTGRRGTARTAKATASGGPELRDASGRTVGDAPAPTASPRRRGVRAAEVVGAAAPTAGTGRRGRRGRRSAAPQQLAGADVVNQLRRRAGR